MIELYTDGACSGNPGPGGWAFAIVKNGNIIHSASEFVPQTTNNICELLSLCNGLNYILTEYIEEEEIHVYSDSAYCVNGWNDWMDNWAKNGWLTAKKEPVKNKEHWIELLGYKRDTIKVMKVKGHGGNKYNNFVDRLAVDEYKKNA